MACDSSTGELILVAPYQRGKRYVTAYYRTLLLPERLLQRKRATFLFQSSNRSEPASHLMAFAQENDDGTPKDVSLALSSSAIQCDPMHCNESDVVVREVSPGQPNSNNSVKCFP
jgi:hypothetical protein